MTTKLLIYSLLEQKINNSVKEIDEILEKIAIDTSPIILKSVFSFGVSHFENILTTIIKDICRQFPDRIKSKDYKLSQKQIIDEVDVFDLFLDNAINNMTYKDLATFIEKYSEITHTQKIDGEKINRLIEIKETRNLIIHNDLKINTTYLEKCENNSFCRADENSLGKPLSLDEQYVRDAIELIRDVIETNIIPDLKERYGNRTQKKAMKELWNNIFNSSILRFEEFWSFDDKENLEACLKPRVQARFSTTEKILFAKIVIHYSGDARYEDDSVFPAYMFNTSTMYGDRYDAYLYLEKELTTNPQLFSKDF